MMGQRTIDTILRVQNENGYKTALKQCSSELKVMKSELDRVTSEFRNNANSMEALTQKKKVLSDMYELQATNIDLLRGAMEKAQSTRDEEQRTVDQLKEKHEQAKKALSAYGDAVDKNSEEYKQAKAEVDKYRDSLSKHQAKVNSSAESVAYYTQKLNKAEIELNDLRDKQDQVNSLMEEAQDSVDGCATSMDRYGDKVQDAADGTKGTASAVESLASAMVASGVQQKVEDLAAAMMACSEAAQEYETKIAQVSTIADESVISQKAMHSEVLSLSKDLRKDPDDVAAAAYESLSAGISTANILSFTSQASQLAVAGYTDVASSVDVLTTILNAYKLEADQTEKVASTLVKTQDLGKITVDDLGKVMGRVIPSASAYSVNLDNIATAYAVMTASGINAENTTTYLSTMMDELADSGSSVAKILQEQTGKSFAELMSSGASLGDVLESISKSVDYDNVQFSNLWSSATAGRAAISLFDGSATAFNETLNEMKNSSGAVAANYKKMTDTSEYSSQRLEVASKNLKIAVGNQLNPELDKLREAGAAVLEKATEVVSNNPALVSAITGVVVAVGLLTTGLTAMMVVKTVTAAMKAFNITLSANPVGLVAVAVAGLVAALATFKAQTEAAKAEVDKLTESSRNLSTTVANGKETYESTVLSAQTSLEMVTSYIDRLKELEAQGRMTDAQQTEYSLILEKINTLMPDLNAELDEETKLVKGGTEALSKKAEAWAENAKMEAATTRYKKDVAALADAEYELALNTAKLKVAEQEEETIRSRLVEVIAQMNAETEKQNSLLQDYSRSAEEVNSEYAESVTKLVALDKEFRSLDEKLEKSESDQANLTEAIATGNETIEANRTEVELCTTAYNALTEQYSTTAQTVAEESENMATATQTSVKEIQESYSSLLTSAKDSIGKQIELFEDLSGKCEMSVDEMIENLKSQQIAYDNYATNIQKAMERGIDIGMIQKLSDGSAESMQILEALVSGTDEQISELNEIFKSVGLSKEEAASQMALAGAGWTEGLEALKESLYNSAYSLGANAADGHISGFRSRQREYELMVEKFADAGVNQYAIRNEIRSPSKRWERLAQWDVAAPLKVYKETIPKMEEQASRLADAGYLGSIRSRQAQIATIDQVAAPRRSSNPAGVDVGILEQILAAIKAGAKLYLDREILVGETVGDYDTALGYRKILVDRGAK